MDEVLIHVAPVLIGDGIRLFSQNGMEPVRLEKTEIPEAGQITDMRRTALSLCFCAIPDGKPFTLFLELLYANKPTARS
ncbi:MAG: hypothetical protein EOS35_19475 [Mesorhizobium sp.]|nr:MAG: hypothetical protein EOS35_19475 [Mesorhizobium sp.]TIX06405.1 MAG: hypothetical protein E5V57_06170 [Mesorhizobium sp.]